MSRLPLGDAYELLRLSLNCSADAVAVSDLEARLLLWNRAAEEVLGVMPTGRDPVEWCRHYLVMGADGAALEHDGLPLIRAIRGEEVDALVRIVTLDAPVGRWVEVRARPVRGADGVLQGAVIIGRDVTRQHETKQQVVASRAEWQAVVDHAPVMVETLALDGTVQYCNRTVECLDTSRVIGHHWLERVPALTRPSLQKAFDEVVATGQSVAIEVSLPEGRGLRWVEGHLGPILADGAVTGVVLVAQDTTERRAAHEQLRVAERMASLGSLASDLGHEINNPLAVVMSSLELGRSVVELGDVQGERRDKLATLLSDAQTAAERMRRLVRDLEIFSRREDTEIGPVALGPVLETALRLAAAELRDRATVVRQFEDVPLVDGNESRLGQVFLNLLLNAAQSIPAGRAVENEVRVTTRAMADGRVAVEIADTGAGMPQEVVARLFTPFFTTKSFGEGTGLGLSICHRIVESLGGSIQVTSAPGRGSTFTVCLATARETPPPSPEPAAKETAPRDRRTTVLVVDDEVALLSAIARMLRRVHDVTTSAHPREALARFVAGERFDVVVCDLRMPGMNGLELREAVRSVSPEQADRFCFMTGGAPAQLGAHTAALAECTVLHKPFAAEELKAMIARRLAAV